MSKSNSSQWLMSQRSDFSSRKTISEISSSLSKTAKTIAVLSGKGGVGKTTSSLALGREFVEIGKKVLVIDCDYNLSNTAVKLGAPLNDNFMSLLAMKKSFEECIYQKNGLDILFGCNGNLELFDKDFSFDQFIISILAKYSPNYDYVILDCPAGIGRDTVNLASYCDQRFIVVNPDRSSITDSYALIKILNTKHSVNTNHLIVNRVCSEKQFQKVVKSLVDTVDTFLNAQLKVLGAIKNIQLPTDRFDQEFNRGENSSLHKYFSKIVSKYTEEDSSYQDDLMSLRLNSSMKHEVRTSL